MRGFRTTVVSLAFGFLMGFPAYSDWTVLSSSFQEGRSDPSIREHFQSVRDMGGLILIVLKNESQDPLQIQKIDIAGKPLEELMKEKEVFWWRQRPASIEPGQMGSVEICGTNSVFGLSRKPLSVQLTDAKGRATTTGVVISEDKLVIGYFFREGDGLTLYVRNDEPWMRYTLQGLVINGQEVQATIQPSQVGPGDVSLITVENFQIVGIRDLAIVELKALDVAEKEVSILKARTLADPRFPIGVWQNSSGFKTPEYRQELKDLKIDCPFMDLKELNAAPDAALNEHGFRPMGNPRPFHTDEKTLQVTFDQEILDFCKSYGDSPRIIAYNTAEEPEHGKEDVKGYSKSYTSLLITEALRPLAPRHPIVGTLCSDRKYYEFAPIFDIPIMDAYRVTAPSNDQWPVMWGNYLETVIPYTRDLKLNVEPSPVWVWGQGIHLWTERMIVNGQFGRPIPSGPEARAQLYMQLGAGAKGVLWFQYISEEPTIEGYRKKLTEGEGSLFLKAAKLEDRVEEGLSLYRTYWTELRDAMKAMDLEMCRLRPILSRGDVYPHAWVSSASQRSRMQMGAIAGKAGVVLFPVNLDYDFAGQGYVFHPQKDVCLSVTRPGWIQDLSSAWILQGDQISPVSVEMHGDEVSVKLPELADGAVILLGAPGLAESLTLDTQSLNP